jgi:ABC-2 type transport system ATP-binding protein
MLAIHTGNLSKIYRRQHLGRLHLSKGIEEVNLDVEQGEIYGLLGLNGSGKTTTIKLLLGLLRPTSGSISLLDKRMPDVDTLSKVGYLPEVPSFYPYLTAKETLRFYADLSDLKNSDQRLEEILNLVGLSEAKEKRLSEFSKGMLQRVGIAQSLVHDPQILFYDEPVTGLDPLAIHEMRNLILRLKEQGKTVFLSSHLISEVEKVCDSVGILSKGRLVKKLKQSEWSNPSGRGQKEGELERIFIEVVK